MSTILVTGGSGLIGYALNSILKNKYNKDNFIFLSSKNGDLCNYQHAFNIFNSYKPDKIIHLAASVGGLYMNQKNNYNMFMNNMKMNMNIIEMCKLFNIKEGIMCLSTCIYPNEVSYPIKEEYLHNGKPHNSNYGYSYAKRNLEIMVDLYNKDFNANITCITPTNIYGPNDNFNLDKSHVLPALIHKAYLSKLKDTPFVIKGSGKAKRQFIYSFDVSNLILKLLYTKNKNSNYILSPDVSDEISINDLIQHISTIFGIHNIVYDKSFSEDFIREFQNEVYWEYISISQTLSEDFIREFQHKVNWSKISRYQTLSEDFIREFHDKINWYYFNGYQTLSEDFIREFHDEVDWERICCKRELSKDLIRDFFEKLLLSF